MSGATRVPEPGLVEHVTVNDFEGERSGLVAQAVACGEVLQVAVGIAHEHAERVALGYFAEELAVGAAYDAVEPGPVVGFLLQAQAFGLESSGLLHALEVHGEKGLRL